MFDILKNPNGSASMVLVMMVVAVIGGAGYYLTNLSTTNVKQLGRELSLIHI